MSTVETRGQIMGEPTVEISDHARKRMAEMFVDDDEVIDAVLHPDLNQPALDPDNPNRRIATKGRIRAVYAHEDNHRLVVCTVVWEGTRSRADGPPTTVPNKPSNRVFIDKLQLWGCSVGRKRGDLLQMRTPGGHLLQVRPAGIKKGNSSHTLIEAYKSLGVSAEEFWSRTEKVRLPRERLHAVPSALAAPPPAEPDPVKRLVAFRDGEPDDAKAVATVEETTPSKTTAPEPTLTSHAGRVLAYYRGHPGETPAIADVAKAIGLRQVSTSNSAAELARLGLLERTGRGLYRYRRWGESDAAKEEAQRNLEWATDPKNWPKEHRRQALHAGSVSARVLAYYRERQGQAFTAAQVIEALGVKADTAEGAIYYHLETGRLEKVKKGLYRWVGVAKETPPVDEVVEPEVVEPDETPVTYTLPAGSTSAESDPLQRLDAIQRRLDAEPPAPAPVEVAPAPAPAPAKAPPATIEDEVDALLDLLVPGGLKARHLSIAARWVDATVELIRATRGGDA